MPITPSERVPSHEGEGSCFHNFDSICAHLPGILLAESEVEFNVKIRAVFSAGLLSTHLDWHTLMIGDRKGIPKLMTRLALGHQPA